MRNDLDTSAASDIGTAAFTNIGIIIIRNTAIHARRSLKKRFDCTHYPFSTGNNETNHKYIPIDFVIDVYLSDNLCSWNSPNTLSTINFSWD
jgi:hypothetical protein